jgi:amidase
MPLALVLAVALGVVLAPQHATAAVPDTRPGLNLDSATIPELQVRMSQGRLTSEQLTETYLHRIATIDPKLHSVLFLDPTALTQARASDERRRDGRLRGPLDGIPVLLKDNIDTAGLGSTAGSRALLAQPPRTDAALVTRLRNAGAVLLGKTNLSEWANFRSTTSTSGWSGVGGQTNNPYVLDRNPCGSSSGSGAAVAASLAQVAIGTETDGSIVCPSGTNGDVGIKPTLGLISGQGIVPISHEQDTAGPIARNVTDVAITLGVLTGRPMAAATNAKSLRGKRIGVWRLAGIDPAVDQVVQQTVATLTAAGATVIDVTPANQDQIGALELPALLTEFHHDLNAYLATRPGVPQSLAALIAFNQQDLVELSKFGQELFTQAQAAPPITDPTYQQERATATSLAQHSIDDLIAADHLDAIIAPTNSPAWLDNYTTGDPTNTVGSSTPAAVAGYPDVTVPAGFAGPLPIGISFMAGRFTDARMLALAAAFEQVSHARKPPTFLPTLGGKVVSP